MKKATAIRDTALEFLKKHKTPDAAAKPFADLIEKDGNLRQALALEYLTALAPRATPSRRRSGVHRRSAPITKLPSDSQKKSDLKMPSESQKKSNLAAAKTFAHEVFNRRLRGGKRLGDIRINELRAYARQSAEVAGRFIQRGYEDAVDLFACVRLAGYCVAADPDASVSETIKPSIAVEIYHQARIDAAEEIATRGAMLSQDLMAAATARGQQQIEQRS
jgi:hypothetical protein